MKIVIPAVIKIGPLDISVVFSDTLMEKMNDRSSCNIKEQIIRLRSGCSNDQLFANLIHEVDHIVEDVAGIDTKENSTIGRANLMAQALLSMGIEPDFSQIPKEVVE